MSQSYYTPPSARSIIAGIILAILAVLALFFLPDLVKWLGWPFTYFPSQVGLIDTVSRNEVITADFKSSPTEISISQPGQYALFTDNYQYLSITDIMVEEGLDPWLYMTSPSGQKVTEIEFITRGLAPYDTPFAKGRPLMTFTIKETGKYTVVHPTQPTLVYVVPDTTTGDEQFISFLMITQIVLIATPVGIYFWRRRQTRTQFIRTLQAEQRRANEAKWEARRKKVEEEKKDRWKKDF